MDGLYVSITPEGKLKRHLSIRNREVPLDDATVGKEVILFVEDRPLKALALFDLYRNANDDSDFASRFLPYVDLYLSELSEDDPVSALLIRTQIADTAGKYKITPDPEKNVEALMPHLMEPWHMLLVVNDVLNTLCAG